MKRNIQHSTVLATNPESVVPHGWDYVKSTYESAYNTPLADDMKKAYEINVRRAAEVHGRYAAGDRTSMLAVENYVIGLSDFNAPAPHIADAKDRKLAAFVRKTEVRVKKAMEQGVLPKRIAQEFLHTVSDFTALTSACVTRSLEQLSGRGICEDDCLSRVFYNKGAIDPCATTGRLGIIPVKSSGNAGCPHSSDELCDCSPTKWKFGETGRDDFGVGLFKDEISISWWLRQCALYGGWDQELLSWILRIKNDRKNALRASLLGGPDGLNSAIFNAENDNIISAGGVCNPAADCPESAVRILEEMDKILSYRRDNDGLLLCNNRQYLIVTGDKDVECNFQKALVADIQTLVDVDGDACATQVRTTAPGCFPNVEVCYSARVREALGEHNADGKFFFLPVSEGANGRNAFEEATMRGFEGVRFVRKHPMFTSMTGQPIVDMGSDYCFTETIMAVDSYGAGSIYGEMAFASDGTGEGEDCIDLTGGEKKVAEKVAAPVVEADDAEKVADEDDAEKVVE